MQPLNRVNPNASVAMGQNDIMQRHPELSVLIAECNALWAETDYTLGIVLGMMLGTDYKAGVSMYLSLTSTTAQRAALNAAAEAKLPADRKLTFDAILRLVDQVAKKRNKLTHWCWGYSPQLPNALLLIDPAFKVYSVLGMEQNPEPIDRAKIFVIRENFLRSVIDEMIEVKGFVGRVTGNLWHRNSVAQREQYHQQLSNEPRVAEARCRLSERQRNNP